MPRLDAYENFKFRLKWNGAYVAGVARVSGLSGAETGSQAIMLERGVTHEFTFEQWANRIVEFAEDAPEARALRRDFTLELLNTGGGLVASWTLRRCWPSQFVTLSDLDSSGNAIVIQTVVPENEGWAIN
jgi:phage tail-like protein